MAFFPELFAQLGHGLHTKVNESDFAILRGFIFTYEVLRK